MEGYLDGNVLLERILHNNIIEPSFVLNGFNFGRGGHHIRCSAPSNCMSLLGWKVCGKDLHQLPPSEIGNFLDKEAYIIKAKPCSRFDLPEDFGELFFYWKGIAALKGASPLPPEVSCDQPVQRISQWSEPTMFLHLFSGCMLVHSTIKHEINTKPTLFIMCGETHEETRLYEVPCHKKQLRSKSCLFVIDVPNNQIIIWLGCKTMESAKYLAKKAVETLVKNALFNFLESKVDIKEQNEGSETVEFTNILQGSYEDYYSYKHISFVNVSPRLFYFHKLTGDLDVIEIENIYKNRDLATQFPFLQSHFHSVVKPALFLLDAAYRVWIWHSCMATNTLEEQSQQFYADLKTVKHIGQEYSKKQKYQFSVEIIISGDEPKEFTNMFPYWEEN